MSKPLDYVCIISYIETFFNCCSLLSKIKNKHHLMLAFRWRRRRDLSSGTVETNNSLFVRQSVLVFIGFLPHLSAPSPCHRQRSRSVLSCRSPALEFKSFLHKKKQASFDACFLVAEKERFELSRRFPDLHP